MWRWVSARRDVTGKGWPDYLAHGGVTVNAPETVSLYRDIPFSALFKYRERRRRRSGSGRRFDA